MGSFVFLLFCAMRTGLKMMLVALVVVVGVAQMVEVEGSTITLLGAIYGAEGMFCDSFYAVEKECQGAVSCGIPVGNASICLKYGIPNPKPINVMHVLDVWVAVPVCQPG